MGATPVGLIPMLATFFGGGSEYNLASFLMNMIGLLLAVIGLVVAIWQIVKTRHAAEAAQNAAADARREMAALAAVVSISRLVYLASELIQLIRLDEMASAAQRGLDLRQGAAIARFAISTGNLLSASDWQRLMTRIGYLHEALESAKRRKPNDGEFADCMKVASVIHETLSGMTGLATNAIGATNANS